MKQKKRPRGEAAGSIPPQIYQNEQSALLGALFGTIQHFFGSPKALLGGVEDPRDPRRITYPLRAVLLSGVLMFLCQLGARRQVGWKLRTQAAQESFRTLFGVESVPHGDTLERTFRSVEVQQVQQVVSGAVRTLIRSKALYGERLMQRYFVVVLDGTGTVSFDQPHCEQCLRRKNGAGWLYYHNVLEAKLVTSSGFAFSMMSEFIENSKPLASKQDSELKAFARLAPRLKAAFPRLPIVLSLDGLYAEGPVFDLCRRHGWHFIAVLKDADLPFVNSEFAALSALQPQNRLRWRTGEGLAVQQSYRWADDIQYVDSEAREHSVSVLECLELKVGQSQPTKHKWVTSLSLTKTNVPQIANEGGRIRWKIENEGFNAQKNGGFALEHPYSNHPTSSKVFYLLLQLSHTLFQLLSKGSLLGRLFPQGFGSLLNLGFRLLEAWRNTAISPRLLEALARWRFQYRFDTS